MNRRTKAAFFSTGLMLSAAAIHSGVGMMLERNLVGEALDREEPKTMVRMKRRMKGARDDDPPNWTEVRRSLEQTPHQTVAIQSFDGTPLTGHLFAAEHPRRIVVAMHGWRSSWARDFGFIAAFLQTNACTVLYAEQRGQGESGGSHMGFGMIERYDCLEWVRWLNQSGWENIPIYLAGISMGAATVLMTAGFSDLPKNVAGIVADCGFTSPHDVWKHVSENNLHIPYRSHQRRVDALCRKRISLCSDAYSTLEAMKTNRTPILFIHGSADTFVPPEMTRANYDACTAPKHLLIVEGATHAMSYLVDKQKYEQSVLAFWEECEQHPRTSGYTFAN